MDNFVGLLKIESAAGFVHLPDGDRPYVEIKLWTFTPTDEKEWPRVRMSQEQATALIGHLQRAIAAPAIARTTKPPSQGH